MSRSIATVKKIDLLLEGASQIVTCQGNAPDALGVLEQGWIAISGERIAAVGQGREELEAFKAQVAVDFSQTRTMDVSGKVVAPGFVDCHTHLVFEGSRIDEYVSRLPRGDMSSLSRRNILTGLEASTHMTREASENHLFDVSKVRLDHMLAVGTTTAEIKSGYGFTTEHELKQLRVIRRLGSAQPIELHPTFLGAHGWPSELKKADYIRLLIEEMIPEVGRSGLATACDVWCDDGYYTASESEKILSAALGAGMKSKIHTDAYSLIGGSELAADMKMLSADRGSIEPGKRADLQVWDTNRYENIIYRQGTNLVERVIKNGTQVIGSVSTG